MPAWFIVQQVMKVAARLIREPQERRTAHREWRSLLTWNVTRLGRGRRLQSCATHSAELILRIVFMTALVTADYHKIKHKYNQFGCWIEIPVWLVPGCLYTLLFNVLTSMELHRKTKIADRSASG